LPNLWAALLARSLEQILCSISLATFLVQQLLGRIWRSILWRTFLCRDRIAQFVVQHCPASSLEEILCNIS
jgi:hypothetical protein